VRQSNVCGADPLPVGEPHVWLQCWRWSRSTKQSVKPH